MKGVSKEVLIVDENEFRAAKLRSILVKAGLTVASTSAGPGGRKAAGAALIQSPSVIIIDISAMNLNGIAAISIIRFLCPEAKIVAMCSNSDAFQLTMTGDLGVSCFINPELGVKQILGIINAVAGWSSSSTNQHVKSNNGRHGPKESDFASLRIQWEGAA
jgi:DNA-binding NarL/FixJ family response regulator